MKKAPENAYVFTLANKQFYARVFNAGHKPVSSELIEDFIQDQKEQTKSVWNHYLAMEKNHSKKLQTNYDIVVEGRAIDRKELAQITREHNDSTRIIEGFKQENRDLRKTEQKYFDLQKDHYKLGEQLKQQVEREREISREWKIVAVIAVSAMIVVAASAVIYVKLFL